jgi:hypothetical protein
MMRCEEIEVELDAFLTGELETEKSAEIEKHLQQCSHCRAELAKIREESALYQEYGSSVDIPVCKWTSRSPHASFPRWILAAAAMVLLTAGLSWYFYAHRSEHDMAGFRNGKSSIKISIPIEQTVNDLDQTVTLLQTSYAEKKQNLDPKLVKELDRNLDVTRTAIAECKQALVRNPGNDQVIGFLMNGYEKQIDILKQITEEL